MRAQNSGSQPAQTSAPVQATPSVVDVDPAYKIGPQDVLRVDVWKEPEISRTLPVRPDGKVSLPLLNDVQAAGLTPVQLASKIADGLEKIHHQPTGDGGRDGD